MRASLVVAIALLASALAPIALAADRTQTEAADGSTVPYVIFLKDQRSHDASLAVRSEHAREIDALAERRAALVTTPADLEDPVVRDLNRQIDFALGGMRADIAAEATRRHAPTRSVLESFLTDLGGRVTYRSPLLNMLVARIPQDRLDLVVAHPLVASVEPEGVMDVLLDISVPSSGAPSFWSGGFTGGPFKLVVPDTGVDANHPALAGKISDAQVFHTAAQGQGNYGDNPATPDDLHGHGTHIAGIVASQDGTYEGVAHGMLGVVNVKFGYLTTGGGGQGVWSDAWAGIDWSILVAGGDVLSFSFGGGGNNDGNDAMSRFMDALVDDLGIPVSVAAGNSGPGTGSLGQPATAYNILSVGAVDDQNTMSRADDGIVGFSSRGPTSDGRLKPDISAPGVDIIATAHDWETSVDWVGFSGTSMASPHVGAGLLLFLNAAGGPAFPARSKAIFLNTATDRGTPGADNAHGWGYLDLATAWAQRNNVIEGTTAPGSAKFYRITGVAGDRATLVWQKHVTYNGPNAPNPQPSLNNLDLALYDEGSQMRLGASQRARDNVEQVSFTAAATGIVKVHAAGPLLVGTDESFALAARTLPTAVAAPALSLALTAPPVADSGANFIVSADVTNTGGLRLGSASVTLNIPPGVALVSGSNPRSLGPIPAGIIRTAQWTVMTNVVGVHTFTADSQGTAYEESYAGTGGPIAVTVLDITPPTIALDSAVPSPQNVGGIVNVSAAISDNVGVAGSWVEIRDPASTLLGNYTLTYDPISGRRFFATTYATIGAYDYWMSASDASGLWSTASGSFAIADLEAPVLAAVSANPDPQEVYFSVNVTALATDNVGIAEAFLEVWDPLGGGTNASMAQQGSLLYLERSYGIVGLHTYTVSVRDAAMNWDARTDFFLVHDTTRPTASAGPDQTIEAGSLVAFDGSASFDNVGIVSYEWTFDDGGPWTLTGATADHTFFLVGTYVVTLTVQDAAGNTGTDDLILSVVDPLPPLIEDVRADPSVQDVGGPVTVSATVTDDFGVAGVWARIVDPQGGVVNGTMDLVDSRYTTGATYVLKGVYQFDLWASDTNGNWATARGGFRVMDLTPPVVMVTAVPVADVFSSVTVTGTIVENDALADVFLEVRDPAGGSLRVPMVPAGADWEAIIDLSALGTHSLTVRAKDASGNTGVGHSAVLAVDRVPPLLAANAPAAVEILHLIPFSVDVSDNLGPFVANLEIWAPSGDSLGNRTLLGSPPYAITMTATSLGPYAWTATAVDPSGNRAVVRGTVQARDTRAPIADAGPDRTLVQGTGVPFDASGSSDNFGIESFTWTFGPGITSRGVRTSYAFAEPGVFTVQLLVRDFASPANSDTDVVVITVVPADADSDGSWDANETEAGTDPLRPDTDGDTLRDGEDPEPLSPRFDIVHLFASWFGVLVLFVVFLALLVAGIARRRKSRESEPDAPPDPAVSSPPELIEAPAMEPLPPLDDAPPPPED